MSLVPFTPSHAGQIVAISKVCHQLMQVLELSTSYSRPSTAIEATGKLAIGQRSSKVGHTRPLHLPTKQFQVRKIHQRCRLAFLTLGADFKSL